MMDLAHNWSSSWAWSLPLILLTVALHAFGLRWVSELFPHLTRRTAPLFCSHFMLIVSATVFVMTVLHGIEATAWTLAYVLLGALPDLHSAMLYSLGAMTTYGHENLDLAPHWQMMGALEVLNGMILFGLTTAFLFALVQAAWPSRRSEHKMFRNCIATGEQE